MTFASTTDLKHFLAIANEAMRLHPTPAHLARITPLSGHTVDGHWIPGNVSHPLELSEMSLANIIQTTVGVQMNAASHAPDNFVVSLTFLPERWLPNGDSHISKIKRRCSSHSLLVLETALVTGMSLQSNMTFL